MHVRLLKAMLALGVVAASVPASAQFSITGRSENKSQFYVYDIPADVSQKLVQDAVYQALTDQTTGARVNEPVVNGQPPAYPAKMTFKELSYMVATIQIPECAGASFTLSSSDNSMANWGEASQYMACGFRYMGGWRVDIYVATRTSSGGIFNLGKDLGRAVLKGIGMNSDPMQFVERSVNMFEQTLKEASVPYSLVEATPFNPAHVVTEDALLKTKASADKRAANRSKRMAARAELQKNGVDATDRARLIRAIQQSDEDIVSLFIEAGAIDLDAPDASGRRPVDYASKPSIKELLVSAQQQI